MSATSALSVLNANAPPSSAAAPSALPTSAAAVLGHETKRFKYDFPPLQPAALFYACGKCQYRHLAHFMTTWHSVESKRPGGETLWSPGLLLCQTCAEFNINLYLEIEKKKGQ